MQERAFHQVDVFTDTPYFGNPVAVVLQGDGLDDATMQRFADLGLDIYITEMDIALPIETSEEDYTEQANAYHQVMEAALAQPAVKAIQIWGFTDRFSWIEKSKPGFGNPLLFDKNYKPKAAYYAVQAGLLKAKQPDHATKIRGNRDHQVPSQ